MGYFSSNHTVGRLIQSKNNGFGIFGSIVIDQGDIGSIGGLGARGECDGFGLCYSVVGIFYRITA